MRTHVLSAVAVSSLLVACGNQAASSRSALDSLLRAELLERGRADQAVRHLWMEKLQRGMQLDSAQWVNLVRTDSANTKWLKGVVQVHGWPGKSRVGPEAANAALLILQHTPDTAFRRETLGLIRRTVAAGEVDAQELAMLTDRVEVHAGRPQLYGTQATIMDGRVVLDPIVDSAQVDERRAKLGLMPLAEYVRLLESMYTARDSEP